MTSTDIPIAIICTFAAAIVSIFLSKVAATKYGGAILSALAVGIGAAGFLYITTWNMAINAAGQNLDATGFKASKPETTLILLEARKGVDTLSLPGWALMLSMGLALAGVFAGLYFLEQYSYAKGAESSKKAAQVNDEG